MTEGRGAGGRARRLRRAQALCCLAVSLAAPGLRADVAALVDVGRQLFVDDRLVAATDGVERVFHRPVKFAGNPVLKPETALERNGSFASSARPCAGGIWWDPHLRAFRYWYEAGFLRAVAYAESKDGVHFARPTVRSSTNQSFESDIRPDSWCVTPDFRRPDPYSNWLAYLRGPGGAVNGFFFESADPVDWRGCSRRLTGKSGDRSNFYYDPFRGKWVFALRAVNDRKERVVRKFETDDPAGPLGWDFDFFRPTADCPDFLSADDLDLPDPAIGDKPQLYAFNAVAYESIMVGAFEMLKGPNNWVCATNGLPKITDVEIGYSRNGVEWMRPDRTAFIASERWGSGAWDTGYVQMAGNLFAVVGDELWFYYGAARGDPGRTSLVGHNFPENGMYHDAATGVAKLRRDGFASLRAATRGSVRTAQLLFSGRHLFVNASARRISAAAVDADGREIEPYTSANCIAFSGDSTRARIAWRGAEDVSALASRPVSFRFDIEEGDMYSFWVSRWETGESGGYTAGGGPGLAGWRDVPAGERFDAAEPRRLRLNDEIRRVSESGGGRVSVPRGVWRTGGVRLESNVELHLEEGSVLAFSDDPGEYLPAVRTSWEGVECLNYSPLVYAYGATNIAITGKGVLYAEMDGWRPWAGQRKPSAEAAKRKLVFEWGARDVPVESRDLTRIPGSNLRPQFIGLNGCAGVRLEDFTLRNSPFWCIHLLHSRDVALRRLDVAADINNSDGANFECTSGVVVEDCLFDQGDDVVCCKSGLDRDGRRRAMPTENVLVRRCRARHGHGLFTMGSECSGGVRNALMEDCEIVGTCCNILNIKTRESRGGFVENVGIRRIRARSVENALVNLTTYNPRFSVYSSGLDVVITEIDGVFAEDVFADRALRVLNLHGDARLPARGFRFDKVAAAEAREADEIENVVVERHASGEKYFGKPSTPTREK